jgi:hypothetical protein
MEVGRCALNRMGDDFSKKAPGQGLDDSHVCEHHPHIERESVPSETMRYSQEGKAKSKRVKKPGPGSGTR